MDIFLKINIAPEHKPFQKAKIIFQTSIFRGKNVSFKEGISFAFVLGAICEAISPAFTTFCERFTIMCETSSQELVHVWWVQSGHLA